jgi:putative ATP-dependent endonuclease of OLD family
MGAGYTKLEKKDYKFLDTFLDVTKSNLFFAKGVILVEGWAEEILIPVIAEVLINFFESDENIDDSVGFVCPDKIFGIISVPQRINS